MRVYSGEKIRNVVFLGHQGTGKTTLAEALLHLSGATTRMGSVQDGNTVLDFEPEEVKKKISVSVALSPVEWRNHKINLLDAPGYADFVGEAQAAMRVADLAVLVVSAIEGVQVQHEILWRLAESLGLPRFVFINKLDRERANFHQTLDALSARLGARFAPLDLPMGEEQEFQGIADVLTEKAHCYDEHGKAAEESMPADLQAETAKLHTQIVESVAETDDDLLERYLGGEDLSSSDVTAGLHKGVLEGSIFPVLVGSATKLIGIDRLAEAIVEMGPAPPEEPPATGSAPGTDQPVERRPVQEEPFSAFIFKTISDPYVGRVSLFKVLSGKMSPDSTILNATRGADERVAQIFTLRGKHQEALPQLLAGDIGATAKLSHSHTGDTLCDKSNPIVFPPLEAPDRVIAKAIAPKTKGDEDKLMTGLQRIQEEDLALQVERNPETRQTLLWGTGESHLEIVLERLNRKFGVEVAEIPLRIAYRETIGRPGKGLGRHVKQSGGHGQYAICNLEVEPLERGGGFEFVDKIFGGAIPHQFVPSVQKGVEKAMAEGVVAGYPVVDFRATVVDGKFHPVDSSDMAFQIAGAQAFRDAVSSAGVCLLEPIMDLEVLVPGDFLGDIMGDLNSRRGRIIGTDAVGTSQLVKAKVPMAEVARYAIDLRSKTGGQGTFRSTFSHYEEVPAHIAEKIIAEAKPAAH